MLDRDSIIISDVLLEKQEQPSQHKESLMEKAFHHGHHHDQQKQDEKAQPQQQQQSSSQPSKEGVLQGFQNYIKDDLQREEEGGTYGGLM